MNAVATPQPYEVPEGGLGSFLTATVGDWSDEALNADNYYDIVKPTAEQLAEFGREEDDRIAHVATGETVIPMAVFEEDPALKEALFARMRDMGIEPERYVVGNELNSINPVTGQPEFFLKKIFKGVKKAVKGVVKVFKKIAPIVLSIGGSILLGPLGAALGSGIGTLIQGGNLKDAFKSALISGVTAGVTQGISQGFEAAGALGEGATLGEKLSAGIGGFGESIQQGLGLVEGTSYLDQLTKAQGIFQPYGSETKAPIVDKMTRPGPPTEIPVGSAAEAKAAAAGAQPFSTGVEPPAFMTPSDALPAAGTQPFSTGVQPPSSGALIPQEALGDALPAAGTQPFSTGVQPPPSGSLIPQEALGDAAAGATDAAAGAVDAVSSVTASAAQESANRTFFDRMTDFLFRGGSTPEAVKAAELAARNDAVAEYLKAFNIADISMAPESLAKAALAAGDAAAKAAGPGLIARFGPSIGLLIGGTALAGGFEPGPMPDPYDAFAGIDRTPYQFAAPGSQFRAAAGGGEMTNFPRKNGAIYGPGTETSDDIPAMLSDGEFVMTARAVRGAGNGSRQDGMKRMYDMMRTFEGRAARG